jgi:lysophospholipase L1-like esterase
MRNILWTIFIAALLLTLAACTPSAAAPTATLEPTVTSAPSFTPPPSATPLPTITPVPSSTPLPPTSTSTSTSLPPTPTLRPPTITPIPINVKLGVDLPVRIMPMGDSITEGVCDTEENCPAPPVFMSPLNGDGVAACSWAHNYYAPKAVGYRVFLRDKITARGFKLNYVGSVTVVEGLAHEGHSGWEIADLDYCVQNGDWLEKAQPNVILLHIGTNDANNSRTPEEMATRLQSLLEHIYDKLPGTTEIIVAQIIRASTTALPYFAKSNILMNDIITPYNQTIPGVVEKLRAENKHVSFVDMTGVIHSDSEVDVMLGLHPNAVASERMADVWLAKILEVIGQKP